VAREHKGNRKSGILKTIAKALLLICLTAGAFYLGWHFYTMRKSETMVCLTMMSEDGLFIYNYQSAEAAPDTEDERVPEDGVEEADGGDGPEIPVTDPDWGFASFGRRVRVTGVSGQRLALEDIYTYPQQKVVVELVIGPDGKITRISQIPDSFALRAEVEGRQNGTVNISGRGYTTAQGLSFDWEQGDLVEVYGAGDEIIYAELVEKAGTLHVTANVEGAKVYIDGAYKGEAPLTVNTVPGYKDIMVKSPGYRTAATRALVTSGQSSEVPVELVLVTGTLEVTSNPPGADVFVNHELKGTTPVSIQLPPGDCQVSVEKPGYYSRKASLRVAQDTTTPLHFSLVEESSGITGIGGLTPGLPSQEPQISGTRVTVLDYDPDSRVLEVMDSGRVQSKLVVPKDVPLETVSSGRALWDKVLPGEELIVVTSASGHVEKATKVYSHTFTARGKLFAKDGQVLNIGDGWTRCFMSPNVLIQRLPDRILVRSVDVGDTVTAHGASADDIRFVVIEESLGLKTSFEGYLVHTDKGLRVFSDSALLSVSVPGTIDVVDPGNRVTDKASTVPSGSRLKFCQDGEGNIVWAEYIWKAAISLEGQVGLMSGPVITILPSWEEVTLSLNTTVFVGETRRPFYDVKTGDTVLVAGVSRADTGFIWVKDRISYESVVEGFIGGEKGRSRRVLTEVDRKGYVTQWVVDAGFTVVDTKQKTHMLASQLNNGDKVRLWLGPGGKPVWGEMIAPNLINISGHFLRLKDGYYYFTGLEKFEASEDLIIIGLFKDEELRPGSRVHVGGDGRYVNYIEVLELAQVEERKWWADGTVISVGKNMIKIMADSGYSRDFELPGDTWFVDWEAGVDGNAGELKLGDGVKIAVDPGGKKALFIERTYSPRFRVEGTVTAVSDKNRTFTISGEYGTVRVELLSTALVYKDGIWMSRSEIKVGDKVHVSGSSADSIYLVVVTR
jgi:hypothetical protein